MKVLKRYVVKIIEFENAHDADTYLDMLKDIVSEGELVGRKEDESGKVYLKMKWAMNISGAR